VSLPPALKLLPSEKRRFPSSIAPPVTSLAASFVPFSVV